MVVGEVNHKSSDKIPQMAAKRTLILFPYNGVCSGHQDVLLSDYAPDKNVIEFTVQQHSNFIT